MNKVLGLDLGSTTCGVALSDSLGMIATPKDTIRFQPDDYNSALEAVCKWIDDNKVDTVVLGLPKHMNGDNGIRCQISNDFKKKIEESSNIKVILEDERLTTVIVDRAMISGNVKRKDRKNKKDEMAAVVILQNYLDKISF